MARFLDKLREIFDWKILLKIIIVLPLNIVTFFLQEKLQIPSSHLLKSSRTLLTVGMLMGFVNIIITCVIGIFYEGFGDEEREEREQQADAANAWRRCLACLSKFVRPFLLTGIWIPAIVWYTVSVLHILNRARVQHDDDDTAVTIGYSSIASLWVTFTADMVLVYPVVTCLGCICDYCDFGDELQPREVIEEMVPPPPREVIEEMVLPPLDRPHGPVAVSLAPVPGAF